MMFPQTLAIIQVSFPARERGVAFSLMGTVSGAAMFSGNILGGPIVGANLLGLAWRPIFLVNVPVGVLAVLAALPLLRESRSPKASRLDLGGVALGSAGLFLLVFPLVQGREAGWPWWAFVCLALSVPTLAAFVWYERRVAAAGGSPLVELGLFRDRLFVDGLLTTLVFYGGLSAFFLSFTLFLQDGMRLTPAQAGLIFTPFAVGFGCSSTASARLAALARQPAHPARRRLDGNGPDGHRLPGVFPGAEAVLLGTGPRAARLRHGPGLRGPDAVAGGAERHPRPRRRLGAGVLATVQQVSLAVGVAVICSVYFVVLGSGKGEADFLRAVEAALLVNLGLLATAFVLAFRLPHRLAGDLPEAAVLDM